MMQLQIFFNIHLLPLNIGASFVGVSTCVMSRSSVRARLLRFQVDERLGQETCLPLPGQIML